MKLDQVTPAPEQIAALLAYPKDQPVVMVNIVKFKASAEGGNESGAEAYARYGQNVQPLLKKAGGKILWQGAVASTVIGDSEGQPDLIFLVEYPSVSNFLEMTGSPEYQKIGRDRTIALEYGGLLACNTVASFL